MTPRAPSKSSIRPKGWWTYLGLSSALHAAGLLALPAILGLSWWSIGKSEASGPREEVRITWLAAPQVFAPDGESDPDQAPVDDLLDGLSELDPPMPEPLALDWQGVPAVPEKRLPSVPPEPLPVPTNLTPADLRTPRTLKAPAEDQPVENPNQPAVEPPPAPAPVEADQVQEPQDPPSAEPGEVWEPEALPDYCPQPAYPKRAERRRQSGKVLMALTVAPTGLVTNLTVVKSSGHGILDRAAQKTLRTWRFQPGPDLAQEAVIQRWIHFRLP